MPKPPKPPGKPDKPPTEPPPIEPPPVDPVPPDTQPPSGPVVRRLTDCRLPSYIPSEDQPFELDCCTINDGDDITELFKDIGNKWGEVNIRAPSRNASVIAKTTQWSIKTFVFLENSAYQLTINHRIDNVYDTWTLPYIDLVYKGATLWNFQDPQYIKIGGPNLGLTLVGTHPGLGTGDYITTPYESPTPQYHENCGFIDVRLVDGSSPDLCDVRANIRFAHRYSIYTFNGQGEPAPGSDAYRIKEFKVSGLHYATSGVFFHQGVKHAWSDPEHFKVSDPYVRGCGWTGIASSQTQGGLPLGCSDNNRDQVRFAGFGGYYTDSITGGVTFEYGLHNWVQRYTGKVGSASEPYVVRIKDWGVSGPGTAYPAGVRPKKHVDANFFKGDPHDTFGGNGPVRFVRFEKLADDYGSGPGSDYLEGCTPSCAFNDGPSNFLRLENSTTRLNRDWYIILAGDWNTGFIRGDLFYFAFDNSPIYGNTLEAAAGTTITDTIIMSDRNTVTGSGTFSDICVANHSPATPGRDNLISGTTIAGVVDIAENTGTTTIENVAFSGEARTIITIGAGSTAKMSGLLARSGSTIDGAGTLIYNGEETTLPYTF